MSYIRGHSKLTYLMREGWDLEWGGCMAKCDGVLQGLGVFPEPLYNDFFSLCIKGPSGRFRVSFS